MPSVALTSANILVRNVGFMEAEIDREIVALNVEKGTCYGLDPIGARVWRLLGKPIRIADICKTLVNEYEVDSEACERDVLELLEELRAEGMVRQVTDVPEDAAKDGS